MCKGGLISRIAPQTRWMNGSADAPEDAAAEADHDSDEGLSYLARAQDAHLLCVG